MDRAAVAESFCGQTNDVANVAYSMVLLLDFDVVVVAVWRHFLFSLFLFNNVLLMWLHVVVQPKHKKHLFIVVVRLPNSAEKMLVEEEVKVFLSFILCNFVFFFVNEVVLFFLHYNHLSLQSTETK